DPPERGGGGGCVKASQDRKMCGYAGDRRALEYSGRIPGDPARERSGTDGLRGDMPAVPSHGREQVLSSGGRGETLYDRTSAAQEKEPGDPVGSAERRQDPDNLYRSLQLYEGTEG